MSKTDKLLERIDMFLNEGSNDINWDSVFEALMETAKDVFGKNNVDKDKVKDILEAVKKKDPQKEEDAVAIGQSMLRAED